MTTTAPTASLYATITRQELERIQIPDAPSHQWIHQATGMTIGQALERALALWPKAASVDTVELVNAAMADRLRQDLAARAVVMAWLARETGPVARSETVS